MYINCLECKLKEELKSNFAPLKKIPFIFIILLTNIDLLHAKIRDSLI